LGGTGQADGTFRGSTAGKVGGPCRIKRIGQSPDFDVPLNRNRRCAEELQAAGITLG